MTLSVEGALRLQAFSRTTVHVFAGRENLDRAVRWVHPVEIPDIARFLIGGEMLLTAGLGIGRTAAEQRKYIREIREAGAVALVIELSGRAFHTMPTGLIEEAARLGFPLIGLDDEVSFVEVSAQVHELLADLRKSNLAEFEQLNVEFIQLLLAGRDHVSIVETLAHHVGCPAVLEDIDHHVVAYAGGTSSSDILLTNWRLHAYQRHRSGGADDERPQLTEVGDLEPEAECSRRVVVLRGETWGWLHVLRASLDEADAYALNRAADAVAITLLSDRESGARASQRQSSLINRLLLGDLTGEQFVERALRIGRDLRNRPLVVVAACRDAAGEAGGDVAIDAALPPNRAPRVVADMGDFAMAVVGLTTQLSETELIAHLEQRGERAGVSRRCSPAGLPDAIHQARTAVSVAATHDKGTVLHFDRLGILRLFVALSQGDELARFVEDELGVVLDHDADASSPLLPTLRAYLECDANKSRTAEHLFVQRRTLYYRLERLTELLSKSLDDPEVRQDLALAIRALDFLQSRGDTDLIRTPPAVPSRSATRR